MAATTHWFGEIVDKFGDLSARHRAAAQFFTR